MAIDFSVEPEFQRQVQDRGLWPCHLGPELGGPGYGQVKLALKPADGLYPSMHLPTRIEAARARIEARLEHEIANL